jgi:hypothetical protein
VTTQQLIDNYQECGVVGCEDTPHTILKLESGNYLIVCSRHEVDGAIDPDQEIKYHEAAEVES